MTLQLALMDFKNDFHQAIQSNEVKEILKTVNKHKNLVEKNHQQPLQIVLELIQKIKAQNLDSLEFAQDLRSFVG